MIKTAGMLFVVGGFAYRPFAFHPLPLAMFQAAHERLFGYSLAVPKGNRTGQPALRSKFPRVLEGD